MSDDKKNEWSETGDDEQDTSTGSSIHPEIEPHQNKKSRKKAGIIFVSLIAILFILAFRFPFLGSFLFFMAPLILFMIGYLFTPNYPKRPDFYLSIIVCISLSCCCTAIFLPSTLNARRSAWENRCKLTLRAVASCEEEFIENYHHYGAFDELLQNEYIQEGFNQTNLIDEYTITAFKVSNPVQKERARFSSFTIIALPNSTRHVLRTFAINETQTPYVWVGPGEEWLKRMYNLRNAKYWEPLR